MKINENQVVESNIYINIYIYIYVYVYIYIYVCIGVVFEHLHHPFRMTSEVSGHTKGVVEVLDFLQCSRVFYKSLRFPV